MSPYTGSVPDTRQITDWRSDAVCLTEDPELFFPKGTDGPWAYVIEEAKAACRRCPAVEACLQFAFETNIDHGIFGGLTEHERRSLRRRVNARRITGDNITKSAQRARQPQEPRTLRGILDANTTRTDTGHLAWTGPEQIHFKGRVYTPRQAAFIVDRGHYPTGRITSVCGVPDCVLATCIEDYEERSRCGTRAGYQKHLRQGTEICGRCRQANSDADARLRKTGTTKVRRLIAECGTRSGYTKHLRDRSEICTACREANAVASRERYTKKASA